MKKTAVSLLAALAFALPACAGIMSDLLCLSGLKSPEQPPDAAMRADAGLELAPMLDDYLITDAVFQTTKEKAHVSFAKVPNCAGGGNCEDTQYFAMFRTDSGAVYGANLYNIANYGIFKSGQKDIYFDGPGNPVYTVKLMVEDTDNTDRQIITVTRNGRQVFGMTITQILAARDRRARRVSLDRQYMVFLSHGITQDANHELVISPSKSMLTFLPAQKTDEYIMINANALSEKATAIPQLGGWKLAVKDGRLLMTK
ncbi:MAG: hypothetical protein WC421_03395 [Elusimicrobiales bacterium]